MPAALYIALHPTSDGGYLIAAVGGNEAFVQRVTSSLEPSGGPIDIGADASGSRHYPYFISLGGDRLALTWTRWPLRGGKVIELAESADAGLTWQARPGLPLWIDLDTFHAIADGPGGGVVTGRSAVGENPVPMVAAWSNGRWSSPRLVAERWFGLGPPRLARTVQTTRLYWGSKISDDAGAAAYITSLSTLASLVNNQPGAGRSWSTSPSLSTHVVRAIR